MWELICDNPRKLILHFGFTWVQNCWPGSGKKNLKLSSLSHERCWKAFLLKICSEKKRCFESNLKRRESEESSHLHLVRLFWNQVLTWASVIFRALASAARSADARYFCRWKRFSSSQICSRLNDVRGFFFFGGVRFWYGWPTRRVTVRGERETWRGRWSGRDRRAERDAQGERQEADSEQREAVATHRSCTGTGEAVTRISNFSH